MKFLKNNLKIYAVLVLLSFSGIGCTSSKDASDAKSNSNQISQAQGVNWHGVQLTDLPNQPIIVAGESPDHSMTFVQIQYQSDIHSYEIECSGQAQKLKEISNSQLSIPALTPVAVLTNFKSVQMQIMRDRYTDLFRCRYTYAWRDLASKDVREQGPLFLSLETFRNSDVFWTWMIAIDQTTLKIVGLSGIKLETSDTHFKGNYYASSLKNQNNIFGLDSDALVSYLSYYTLCSMAYRSALTPMLGSTSPEYIVPNKEREISRHSEILDDLWGGSNLPKKDIRFLDADASKYNESYKNTSVSLSEIEKLIRDARENHGVGL